MSRSPQVASSVALLLTALASGCAKLPIEATSFRAEAYPVVVAFSDPDPQGNRSVLGPAWRSSSTNTEADDYPNFERPGAARPLSTLALEAGPDSTSPPTHELTLTRRNPASQISLFVQIAGEHYSDVPLNVLARQMQLRIPVRLETGAWGTEVIQTTWSKAGDCTISGVPAYALEVRLPGVEHGEVVRAVIARALRRVDRGWQDLPVLILADYRASEADVAATGPAFDRFLNQLVIEGDDRDAIGGSDCREVWSHSDR